MKYYTADKETGTKIDSFDTFDDALDAIYEYEKEDKNEGVFEYDYYSIIDDDDETVYTVALGRIKYDN